VKKIEDLLKAGLLTRVGNRIYAVCSVCGKVVQVNKPVVGSLHVCLDYFDKLEKRS
jgi:hypothetical protein